MDWTAPVIRNDHKFAIIAWLIHAPDQDQGVPKSSRIASRQLGPGRMQMMTEEDRAAHLIGLKAKMRELEMLFEETESRLAFY